MKKLLLSLALIGGLLSPSWAVIQQTLMGNANLSASITDTNISTSVAFTAARTLTLPAAGGTCLGQGCGNVLEVIDLASTVTATNTLTIAPQSGETINGSTSSLVLTAAGSRVTLRPISGSGWEAKVFTSSLNTEASVVAPWTNYRNVLDNGAMLVQQRGAVTATCSTTAGIVALSYSPDRWGCNVNVTSGAGQLSVVTSTPSPPAGFTQSAKLVRNSGALTQPQCVWQEIRTSDATSLAGQTVVASVYQQALAGLAADQGTNTQTFNLVIITGTGTNQGLGGLRSAVGMTASPALTPVWTGLATLQNTSFSTPATPAWARYVAPAIAVPSTVTEMAVGVCFTPTATGAGATDGIAFTGVQLERAITASPFEFRPFDVELQKVQRYYYTLIETAAITPVAPCAAIDVTHTNCLVQFPVQMDITPVAAFTTGFATPTSTTQATLGACTTIAAATTVASTVLNPLNALVNCTAGTIPAAGIASFLYSNNGSGKITFSADF